MPRAKSQVPTIRKPQFIERYATVVGKKKTEVEPYFEGFLETLELLLNEGNKVSFLGFGDFEVRGRAARTGRNPHTGEPVEIEATKVLAFKAGKTIKDVLNGRVEKKPKKVVVKKAEKAEKATKPAKKNKKGKKK